MTFIRKAGEKCKVFELKSHKNYSTNNESEESYSDEESEEESFLDEDDYPGIEYGDIVYKENGYRALNSYVYAHGFLNLSQLLEANGSGSITLQISKNIEDPYTFFTSEAVGCGDIAEIEISTKYHYETLKRISGNRDFNKKIKFIIDCCNGNEIKFESAKLYNGKTHQLKLCPELEDCYLKYEPFTEIDPITKKERIKMKELYDKNFDSIIDVGKTVMYDFKSKNSGCGGGGLEITNVIHENDKPVAIVTIGTLGITWNIQSEFIFRPFYKDDRLIPTWECTNLDFEPENKNSYTVTLSDFNFETYNFDSENEDENEDQNEN